MKNKKYRRFWLSFDRTLAHDSLRQVGILLGILLAAFCISLILLSLFGENLQNYCSEQHINKWVLPFYLLIDANAFTSLYSNPSISSGAVLASCIIYVSGVIIFTGMIISVMTNMIVRRVKNHQEGHIHYLMSGHYIIMGYDEMVPSIISHIFKDKKAFVLILTSANTTEVKEKLMKLYDKKHMKRIIINYGHRVSSDAFKDIHLESAEQIYIVGNHQRPAHDAINVECVDSICRYLNTPGITQRPNRIVCVFKDLDTYAAFKTSEIFNNVKELEIEFIPYNYYTGWAKQVFVKRKYKDFDNPDIKPYKYPCLFGKGITPNDDRYVHLVFVGTTNFAVAFAMEAAHLFHFPNFNEKMNYPRTRITFIDLNADKEKDEFIVRNRHFFEIQSYLYQDLTNSSLARKIEEMPNTNASYFKNKGIDCDFLDVEFEFIKGDIFSKNVQDEISCWATEHNKKQYLSIFLALANQRQNFVMGMNMPDEVYDCEVPIFIRQDRSDNFVTNLRNADMKDDDNKLTYSTVKEDGTLDPKKKNARYANIYPFGMNETAYCADEHSLKRAKLINYLYSTMPTNNKFQSLLALDAMSSEQIWQEANEMWKELSVALKWSNLYNAYNFRIKLASLRAMHGLDIEDTSRDTWSLSEEEAEIMARVEHNRWNVEKLLMGYRKPHKDEDKYEHPEYASELKKNKERFIHHDIRPFDKLGDIKELDYEFSRYIPWIIRMMENSTENDDNSEND